MSQMFVFAMYALVLSGAQAALAAAVPACVLSLVRPCLDERTQENVGVASKSCRQPHHEFENELRKVWTPHCVQTLAGHGGFLGRSVRSAVFSSDGNKVVTA